MYYFKAPWSRTLVVVSCLGTVLCLAAVVWQWQDVTALRIGSIRFWAAILPLALVAGAPLFAVRGYTVTPDAVLVRRLLWTTWLPRKGYESARIDPDALRRSLRICGNGGFFSFSGWFRSPALGSYRAFVTDPTRAVVVRFTRGTVVVTPSDPEAFVQALAKSKRNA